jgi:SAM-dependent methyltransferase
VAHAEQFEFIATLKAAFPGFFHAVRTLEIGSLDINGSVRRFFEGGNYIGLDVAPGRGVDIVCPGQDYDAPDNSFDTVISCEAMEHNPEWKRTMVNMIRLCRPGGLIVMTCATTGRKEHGTTRTSPADSPLTIGLGWEYYLNLKERDFRTALALEESLEPVAFFANWASRDIYMVAFKRGAPAPANAMGQIRGMRDHYRGVNRLHAVTSGYAVMRMLVAAFGEAGHAIFDGWRPWPRRILGRMCRLARASVKRIVRPRGAMPPAAPSHIGDRTRR